MVEEKVSITNVRRVSNKSEALYSLVNGPYFRYLDEHDGDRELEKYNGRQCSIVKKFESAEYGEMCTVRFADGFEADVLACDIVF